MTSTVIMNAVSAGTSTNIGEKFNPTETALQAGTIKVALNVAVTKAGSIGDSRDVKVFYAVTPTNYSSAAAAAAAVQPLGYVSIPLGPLAPTIEVRSDVLDVMSGYFITWVQMPKLPAACTITATLQESP